MISLLRISLLSRSYLGSTAGVDTGLKSETHRDKPVRIRDSILIALGGGRSV